MNGFLFCARLVAKTQNLCSSKHFQTMTLSKNKISVSFSSHRIEGNSREQSSSKLFKFPWPSEQAKFTNISLNRIMLLFKFKVDEPTAQMSQLLRRSTSKKASFLLWRTDREACPPTLPRTLAKKKNGTTLGARKRPPKSEYDLGSNPRWRVYWNCHTQQISKQQRKRSQPSAAMPTIEAPLAAGAMSLFWTWVECRRMRRRPVRTTTQSMRCCLPDYNDPLKWSALHWFRLLPLVLLRSNCYALSYLLHSTNLNRELG